MRLFTTFWDPNRKKGTNLAFSPSDCYKYAHFENLRSQCAKFGHKLELAPLREPDKYTGWWSKMELYRPENEELRPCVHLDLDTFVMKTLDPLLALDDGHLWMLRGFYHKDRGIAGVTVIPKDVNAIWTDFEALELSAPGSPRGDDDFLNDYPHKYINDRVSGIVSYKFDLHRSVPPGLEVRIVCFHGNPKPPALPEGMWGRQHWERNVD